MPRYRLGIDIGGTFTDFSLLDEDDGRSSPASNRRRSRPTRRAACVEGLQALVAERGIAPGDIAYLVHGTTIAINTVIQRNGAALGLLVTRGFGDVLELQRLRLDEPGQLRRDAPSRADPSLPGGRGVASGSSPTARVDTPLDSASTCDERRAGWSSTSGVEGLVISFLNAFRIPEHEAEARRSLDERHPQVSRSSAPTRSGRRSASTSGPSWPPSTPTSGPRVVRYLETLETGLAQAGVRVPVYITKSNGGVTTARDAREATGADAAVGPGLGRHRRDATSAARPATRNLITLDMGGTSADIALVRDGEPVYSTDEIVGDFPVVMPAVGVSSIGAGRRLDRLARRTGHPQGRARGAPAPTPGPACYGRGGQSRRCPTPSSSAAS